MDASSISRDDHMGRTCVLDSTGLIHRLEHRVKWVCGHHVESVVDDGHAEVQVQLRLVVGEAALLGNSKLQGAVITARKGIVEVVEERREKLFLLPPSPNFGMLDLT